MISDSHTRYGSIASPGLARHGSTLRCRSYQASRSRACGPLGGGARFRVVAFRLSMIWSENRFPLFGIMLLLLPSWRSDMTERRAIDKPGTTPARPLPDILRNTIKDAFAKQGFAATELVTRWPEIVGPEIAAHCEPEKIQWPRPYESEEERPGTLVLRVEGPTAVE